MMSRIDSATIKAFGTFSDRVDSFDDDLELLRFRLFLETRLNPEDYRVVEKPDGRKGVDMGVYSQRTAARVMSFDLERCKTWTDDWPAKWRSLSFLGRKDRYLSLKNFWMVWFNADITKCIMASGTDIQQFPQQLRVFKGQKYTDTVRCVPYAYGTLIGMNFQTREMKNFRGRISYDFTA